MFNLYHCAFSWGNSLAWDKWEGCKKKRYIGSAHPIWGLPLSCQHGWFATQLVTWGFKISDSTRRNGASGTCSCYLRKVSPPLDARRLGFVLDADILRWTPRCVGLCTCELPAVAPSLPAILRSDSDDPDRDPSDSGWFFCFVWGGKSNRD